MWKENIWRTKRYVFGGEEKGGKYLERKMSPGRDKQRTRKDLDFVWVKKISVKIFLGENFVE